MHATDDAVRRSMLGSDDAPPIIESLRRLADSGIRVHAQAVLCPGLNDGEVLERTIQSIAVVPVGLTAHRSRLPVLKEVSAAAAGSVLDTVGRWQEPFLRERGERVVYAADEFYLRAGRSLPPHEEYGDFPQLENGVGLLRSFESDLNERAALLGNTLDRPLSVTLVTGRLSEGFIAESVGSALARVEGLAVRVVASDNSLLGPAVTVAGLMPGADMVDLLKRSPKSDAFLLPGAAFNADGVTLDGMNRHERAGAAGRENVVATDDVVGALLQLTRGADRRDTAMNEPSLGRDPEEEGR